MTGRSCRDGAVLALSLLLLLPVAAPGHAAEPAASAAGYNRFTTGDIAAPTPGKTATGLLLMGGGDWSHPAFRCFFEKAGGGHIVVLRAGGDGSGGAEMFNDIGGITSVETLAFDDRKAATDPAVLATLKHADGIFIAGGDQSNYVRFWKGTPVAAAIDAHVAAGKPIAGTSAGLAILGATGYGSMDGGSIDAPTALGDPLGPQVTMVNDFLHLPMMQHIVTDTHFTIRNRLGRLVAFLAKARTDPALRDPRAIGLGVDENAAMCVAADGKAQLFSPDGGHAWLVQPTGAPGARAGRPLDWKNIRITGIGTDSGFNLRTLKVERPAFKTTGTVTAGKLVLDPAVK